MRCLIVQPVHADGLEVLRAAGLDPVVCPDTADATVLRLLPGCVAAITRDAGFTPAWFAAARGLKVLVVHLPQRLRADEAVADQTQFEVLSRYFDEQGVDKYVFWYYTPMALGKSRFFKPLLTVYDCMDELAAFKFAPPELREREQELFEKADLVFTGGHTLYEAKRQQHRDAARRQQPRQGREDVAVGIKPVGAAIQRAARLVPCDFRHQPGDVAARDVGRVAEHQVEAGRKCRIPIAAQKRGPHRQPQRARVARRQPICAGLPFCSLHATSQERQPMHRVISKWNRYCSPGSSGRDGMSAWANAGAAPFSTSVLRTRSALSVVIASSCRGSGIGGL